MSPLPRIDDTAAGPSGSMGGRGGMDGEEGMPITLEPDVSLSLAAVK